MALGRLLSSLRRAHVARRIFLLCAMCSLLPTLVIGIVVYTRVSAEVTEAAHATLQDAAKRYGLLLHERLERSEEELVDAGARRLRGERAISEIDEAIRLTDMRVVPAGAVPPDARTPRFVHSGDMQLREERLQLVRGNEGYAVRIRVIVAAPDGKAYSFSAAVNPDYLWNTDVVQLPGARLCVRTGKILLNCSGDEMAPQDEIRESWELFLMPHFGVDAWTISVTQPRQLTRAGLASVRQGLPLMAAAALLLALLIGSFEVRRTHGPLGDLLRAFHVMARGRFVQVKVSGRRDEYFRLGRAFNQLSRTLRRQFRLLSTLGRMDHAILERPALNELVASMLPRLPALLDCECVGIAASNGADRLEFSWVGRRDARNVMHRQLDEPDEAEAHLRQMRPELQWERIPLRVGGAQRGLLLCGWRNLELVPRAIRHQARGVARRLEVAMRNEERERQLLRQALEDELTRLPNRRCLHDRVQEALVEAASSGETIAFVYLDLDRFKTLNDSLGHRYGDELLFQVALRLSRAVSSVDTVARIGGDEFALLLRNVTAAGAQMRLDSVLGGLCEPVQVGNVSVQPRASIGIAMYPENGRDFDTLLRKADVAMYRGKSSGGGRIVFYEEQMNGQALRRLQIESGLRQALATERLVVHYQPKKQLADGSLHGMEALLRWEDPLLGPVGPDEFIPVAEESGLIQELGRFALDRSIGFCRQCMDLSLPVGHVAVNVSMLQLCDAKLVDFIAGRLAEWQVPPGMLQVEVTETSIMRDAGMAREVLGRVRALGVRIAIDDFGTGYSSLAVLQTLPVDLLKIDRTFVSRIEQSTQSLELVRAMLALCRALGLQSIAEGVETPGQHALLADNGCDFAQGFLYSRAVPPQAALELIRTWPVCERPAASIMRA